jgi:NAD-dependent dihydropyrimidine dehydrogenase PreA subunit
MGVRSIDEACGLCVEQCPMDDLRLDDTQGNPRAVIQYLRDCQSCALCEAECPEGAIRVSPTFERRVITAW